MIPFNFVYIQVTTLDDAVSAYRDAAADGLSPVYYAGGTEIVTYCRQGKMEPGAVVDIKRIPECRSLDADAASLVYGAALPLNVIIGNGRFPLLSRAATIVDHTVRNRLTLGGNIIGRLPYRETVLPFLVAGGEARVAGPDGDRWVDLEEVFDRRLVLEDGELLVQLRIDAARAEDAWFYRRHVRKTRLDYPILTACFMVVKGELRMATAAAFGFPVRSAAMEAVLNDDAIDPADRPARAIEASGLRIPDTMRAGAAYRRALLEMSIREALDATA